jgi:cytochrome P450
VPPYFYPILGEFVKFAMNMVNGRKFNAHHDENLEILKDKDFEFISEGVVPCLKVVSHEANAQFVSMIPHKIDRVAEDLHIGQMIAKAIGNIKTTEDYKYRKKVMFRLLHFGRLHEYIPMIIESLDISTKDLTDPEKDVEVVYFIFKAALRVFHQIMFGKDTAHFFDKEMPFINTKDEVEMLAFNDFTIRMVESFLAQFLNPFTFALPVVNRKQLCNPFKRNQKNLATFKECMVEAIEYSNDSNSIAYVLKNDDHIKKDGMLDDLIGTMLAGNDTSAHLFCAVIFYCKKYPATMEKLMKELKENGFDENTNMHEAVTKTVVSNMNYLNYVVKEACRLDPPTSDSLGYTPSEDIEICGVPIKKGQFMRISTYAMNHSLNDYIEPLEFIPERFDPESKYYEAPGRKDGKRSPYSWVPFAHGMRGCPGQPFAMMQVKVLVVYLLSRYDIILDDKLLEDKSVSFNIVANVTMNAKFVRKQPTK